MKFLRNYTKFCKTVSIVVMIHFQEKKWGGKNFTYQFSFTCISPFNTQCQSSIKEAPVKCSFMTMLPSSICKMFVLGYAINWVCGLIYVKSKSYYFYFFFTKEILTHLLILSTKIKLIDLQTHSQTKKKLLSFVHQGFLNQTIF